MEGARKGATARGNQSTRLKQAADIHKKDSVSGGGPSKILLKRGTQVYTSQQQTSPGISDRRCGTSALNEIYL